MCEQIGQKAHLCPLFLPRSGSPHHGLPRLHNTADEKEFWVGNPIPKLGIPNTPIPIGPKTKDTIEKSSGSGPDDVYLDQRF